MHIMKRPEDGFSGDERVLSYFGHSGPGASAEGKGDDHGFLPT